MKYQDLVYSNTEADEFYTRNIQSIDVDNCKLRPSKKLILDKIVCLIGESLEYSNVLEIGCFIGDLLSDLRNHYNCKVYGVEPSALACKFAKDKFGLDLTNKIFSQSSYFGCSLDKFQSIDLIILDDVLSWMPRETILPSLASIDWLLKPGGHIYMRDFCPSMDFAYENHHQSGKNVYNYKVSGGHKKFLLNTGMYHVIDEHLRISSAFQGVNTSRPDSMIWSDVLIEKFTQPLQPKLEM
jgi:SAM-dependent methyltransferase